MLRRSPGVPPDGRLAFFARMRARLRSRRGGSQTRFYDRPPCPKTPSTTISDRSGKASRRTFGEPSRLDLRPLARSPACRCRRRARPFGSPHRARSGPGSSAATAARSEAALRAQRCGLEHILIVEEGAESTDPRATQGMEAVESLDLDPRHTFERFVIGSGQPPGPRRRARGRGAPRRGLQPALPPRPAGPRQDPPARRDRRLPAPPATRSSPSTTRPPSASRPSSSTSLRKRRARALQAPLPRARRAAHRRRPGPRGQGAHRGGVRPHLQRPSRRRQADRPLQRPAARGARRARGAPPRPLRMGATRRDRPTRPAHPDRPALAHGGRGSASRSPDPAVLREIAGDAAGNVRRLEGALTRVAALSSVLGEPVEPSSRPQGPRGPCRRRRLDRPPSTRSRDRRRSPRSREPSARSSGSRSRRLLSPSRALRGLPRAAARDVPLARADHLSLAEIARQFDRDHTTILHAVRVVSARAAGRRRGG